MSDKRDGPRILAYLSDGSPWTEEDELARQAVIAGASRRYIKALTDAMLIAEEMGWGGPASVIRVVKQHAERAHRSGDIYGDSPEVRYAGNGPKVRAA